MDADDDIVEIDPDQPGPSKPIAKSSSAWPSKEIMKEMKSSPKKAGVGKRKKNAIAVKKVPAAATEGEKKKAGKSRGLMATTLVNEKMLQNCFGYSCLAVSNDLKQGLAEQYDLKDMEFTPEVIARCSQIVQTVLETKWAPDLSAFSKHAKRATITADDSRLLFQRNPELLKKIEDYASKEVSVGPTQRRPSPSFFSSTDGTDKAASSEKSSKNDDDQSKEFSYEKAIQDEFANPGDKKNQGTDWQRISSSFRRKISEQKTSTPRPSISVVAKHPILEIEHGDAIVEEAANKTAIFKEDEIKDTSSEKDSFYDDDGMNLGGEDIGLSNDTYFGKDAVLADPDEWLSKEKAKSSAGSAKKTNDDAATTFMASESTSAAKQAKARPAEKENIKDVRAVPKKGKEVDHISDADSLYDDDEDILWDAGQNDVDKNSAAKNQPELKPLDDIPNNVPRSVASNSFSPRLDTSGKKQMQSSKRTEVVEKSNKKRVANDQDVSATPKFGKNSPGAKRTKIGTTVESSLKTPWDPFKPIKTPAPPGMTKKKETTNPPARAKVSHKQDDHDEVNSLYDDDEIFIE